MIHYLRDFISLIYPELCNCCGQNLHHNETIICTHCLAQLPVRNDHQNPQNELLQLFWGRVPFKGAFAYLDFKKGSKIQTLLHRLKYQQQAAIGIWLGFQHGLLLKENPIYQKIDYIIPVPLHHSKEKLRTYNQSQKYAEGLALATQKTVSINHLIRTHAGLSQTQKTRMERISDTKSIFTFKNNQNMNNKHLLLVDDIITTGATIEACCTEILNNTRNITLSVATIALTKDL